MAEKLTDSQQEIFDSIVRYIKEYGVSPSMRDIAGEYGMSVNAAAGFVDALERKGWIGKHAGVSRGIYIRLGDLCPCCGQAVKADQ